MFHHLFVFQPHLFQESRKRASFNFLSWLPIPSSSGTGFNACFSIYKVSQERALFFFMGGSVFASSIPACLFSSLESSCCSYRAYIEIATCLCCDMMLRPGPGGLSCRWTAQRPQRVQSWTIWAGSLWTEGMVGWDAIPQQRFFSSVRLPGLWSWD